MKPEYAPGLVRPSVGRRSNHDALVSEIPSPQSATTNTHANTRAARAGSPRRVSCGTARLPYGPSAVPAAVLGVGVVLTHVPSGAVFIHVIDADTAWACQQELAALAIDWSTEQPTDEDVQMRAACETRARYADWYERAIEKLEERRGRS